MKVKLRAVGPHDERLSNDINDILALKELFACRKEFAENGIAGLLTRFEALYMAAASSSVKSTHQLASHNIAYTASMMVR